MPDKPYSVKHEGGEELEPKTGYDHEGKATDMGAPLTQEEMAKGFKKLIGGLRLTGEPIEIEDLSKKREAGIMVEDTGGESAGECVERGYAVERVRARERAVGFEIEKKRYAKPWMVYHVAAKEYLGDAIRGAMIMSLENKIAVHLTFNGIDLWIDSEDMIAHYDKQYMEKR